MIIALCHSRESGNPVIPYILDTRLRGSDKMMPVFNNLLTHK
jgi:hypothetical protein